jgi:HEPN superfamily Swt1-like protein
LRDAVAIAAGLRPELIAFPSVGFPSVVIAAGFKLLLPAISIPRPIESGESSAVYEARNIELFYMVEQSLRDLVESKLLGVVGPDWVKRRVPEAVGKRWQQRQSEERELRRPVYSLIQYADFIDLADVITRGDNWNEVFQIVFLNRDDFRVSLARLHPIRKAMAHCRPLGRADVLTLVAEATRILSALGVATLA